MKLLYSVIRLVFNYLVLNRLAFNPSKSLSHLGKLLLFVACVNPIVAISQTAAAPRLTVTNIEVDGKSVSRATGFNFSASIKASNDNKPLSVNDPFSGALQTPAKTSVALRSLNGNTVRLDADSRLASGSVHRAGERYNLIAGAAEFEVKAPLGFFQIDGDKITLNGRDAKVRLQRLDSNKWEVDVLRGEVSVQRQWVISIADTSQRPLVWMAEFVVPGAKQTFETSVPQPLQFATTAEAIQFYKNRVDAAATTKNDDRIAEALRAQAGFLSGVGKYREAILALQAWQGITAGNNIAQFAASMKIAKAFTALKEDGRAIGYLQLALKNASSPYPGGTSREIYKALSETYARLGDEPAKNRYANLFAGVWTLSGAASYKSPAMTDRGDTKFPQKMRQWGLAGDVDIQTLVTADGTQIETTALKSAHPAFELAAIRGMLSTRTAPGTIDGKPIPTLIVVPFRFTLTPTTTRSRMESGAFKFPKINSSKPEESQYDVAPEIRLVSLPAYPRNLLLEKVTGSALVSVTLDQLGSVQEVNVIEATHPEFGAATKAMMQNWDMAPALKNGKPVAVKFSYEQKFGLDERDNGISEETWAALKRLKSYPEEINEVSALDAGPKVLYQPQAADVRKSISNVNSIDTVQIEFVIDREGGVQLPRIVSATNMDLAWSVATVLQRWLFEIPKVNGDAVFARKEMQFEFR
jgi:TonB family protein